MKIQIPTAGGNDLVESIEETMLYARSDATNARFGQQTAFRRGGGVGDATVQSRRYA